MPCLSLTLWTSRKHVTWTLIAECRTFHILWVTASQGVHKTSAAQPSLAKCGTVLLRPTKTSKANTATQRKSWKISLSLTITNRPFVTEPWLESSAQQRLSASWLLLSSLCDTQFKFCEFITSRTHWSSSADTLHLYLAKALIYKTSLVEFLIQRWIYLMNVWTHEITGI